MRTKIKNNPVAAFEPREGMSFRENVRKNPRTAVLVKPHGPRIWEARNEINGRDISIPTVKLRLYRDSPGSWFLLSSPANLLPENFGQIIF